MWTNQREVVLAVGVLLFIAVGNYLLYLACRKRPAPKRECICAIEYDTEALSLCDELADEFHDRVLRYASEYAEATGRPIVHTSDVEWVMEYYLDGWGNYISDEQVSGVE